MRVVLASSLAAHERRLKEVLTPWGARVERVEPSAHLHLQLLTGNETSMVVLDVGTKPTVDELELTTDIRLRMVHRAQPEVLILGQAPQHGRALSAFEAGVDNWIAPTQSKVLAAEYHFVQCIKECRERGPRFSEGIAFIEDLPLHSTGIIDMTDGTLTAQVSVREGRIGYIHFKELQTVFTDSIDCEVHARCAEVDALRQTLGYPVYDWDRALKEHACWGRMRLRDALFRRWQQAVRWMAGTQIIRLQWHTMETRFAEELAFEPFGLLAALDEGVPHSFARGRISFGSLRAENDLVAVP
jgi:CheY-like chemotaxis protein